MFRVIVIQVLVLAMAVSALGQRSAPRTKLRPACGVLEEGDGRPQKTPVIYGRPYIVPNVRLRITDERTGSEGMGIVFCGNQVKAELTIEQQ